MHFNLYHLKDFFTSIIFNLMSKSSTDLISLSLLGDIKKVSDRIANIVMLSKTLNMIQKEFNAKSMMWKIQGVVAQRR